MYELNRFNGYGLIGSYGLIGLLQMVHDTCHMLQSQIVGNIVRVRNQYGECL